MKLFRLKRNGKELPDTYETKEAAKAERDRLNGGKLDEEGTVDKGYRVTYGPDHWRKQGIL
jgi:hypothetical protein